MVLHVTLCVRRGMTLEVYRYMIHVVIHIYSFLNFRLLEWRNTNKTFEKIKITTELYRKIHPHNMLHHSDHAKYPFPNLKSNTIVSGAELITQEGRPPPFSVGGVVGVRGYPNKL